MDLAPLSVKVQTLDEMTRLVEKKFAQSEFLATSMLTFMRSLLV
jgi:hypothetical protein